MHLLVMRHGKAEDSNPQGDAARRLIDIGREQARRAARMLVHAQQVPDIVLTSPYERALRTAEEFCSTAGLAQPIIQDWLACGMHPQTALRELSSFSEFRRVAIVGHEPDLSCLISNLIEAPYGSVVMKKGAFAAIECSPPARGGALLYLVPPKLADRED
ncbi:MAG: SixA phosphatase family protein [Luteolibacter sp.]